MTALATAIATWFGCGFAPVAPGTAGSLAAVAIAYWLEVVWHWRPINLGLLAVVMLPLGIWSASVVARERKTKDPGIVVVDEVLGQWITLAGAPWFHWKGLLAGFFLFRLFDIWKPVPVRNLEALPAGYGIVADDVMAGVYGALVLFLMGCFNLY